MPPKKNIVITIDALVFRGMSRSAARALQPIIVREVEQAVARGALAAPGTEALAVRASIGDGGARGIERGLVTAMAGLGSGSSSEGGS